MVLALFRRSGNRRLIDRLHGEIVATARREEFYRDYEVVDSVDGRFEMLVLHAALVLRRMRALPPPVPDIAQDLTDAVFRHLDSTLREVGVGDTSVPKRMKKLAEAFFGRARAYDAALGSSDRGAVVDAVARNVYASRGSSVAAARMARYVEAVAAHLEATPAGTFEIAAVGYPDPRAIA